LPPNARPLTFANHAANLAEPVFPAEAAVTISCVKEKDRSNTDSELFCVKFPAAPKCEGHPRGYGYRVTMQTRTGETVEDTCVRKVYPGLFYYGDASDAGNVVIYFRRVEVEDGKEHRFIVEPLNGLEEAGPSIQSSWATYTYE